MTTDETNLRDTVKERYGKAVKAVLAGEATSCCGSAASCAPAAAPDPITRDLYAPDQTSDLPAEALAASFGCGNPTALVDLRPGEVVLDLGSGGGIDVLLSARRVGPTGKAYGLDMTPEMLELARANQAKAGATNVEFLQGTIESIPLPDASVDVVISNCVINLSGDKPAVLAEAFRVLRPGGRFAVSDVVLRRELPPEARRSMELWTGCIGGALVESQYVALLEQAGFVDVSIESTRTFSRNDVVDMAQAAGASCCDTDGITEMLDDVVTSAFVRARKP
jgi:ubiquinone/menaquinone biosynthesis C-methylase UbiE